jgi:hypothetical protein
MIDDDWHKQTNTYQTVYNTKQPGKSPNDISNDKTNEIYSMLATPLKNMRYKVMKDAAANCFKDKWMDEAYPNPHQVELCKTRMENRHMGHFYQNMIDLRESSSYKYKDCVVDAGNNLEKAVFCVRGYLTDIDSDN